MNISEDHHGDRGGAPVTVINFLTFSLDKRGDTIGCEVGERLQ